MDQHHMYHHAPQQGIGPLHTRNAGQKQFEKHTLYLQR
jgi:hypothetical protein